MGDRLATVTIYSEAMSPAEDERVAGDCTIHRQVNMVTGYSWVEGWGENK